MSLNSALATSTFMLSGLRRRLKIGYIIPARRPNKRFEEVVFISKEGVFLCCENVDDVSCSSNKYFIVISLLSFFDFCFALLVMSKIWLLENGL